MAGALPGKSSRGILFDSGPGLIILQYTKYCGKIECSKGNNQWRLNWHFTSDVYVESYIMCCKNVGMAMATYTLLSVLPCKHSMERDICRSHTFNFKSFMSHQPRI